MILLPLGLKKWAIFSTSNAHMLFVQLMGFATVVLLKEVVPIPADKALPFFLTILVITTMPTSSNCIVIAELSNESNEMLPQTMVASSPRACVCVCLSLSLLRAESIALNSRLPHSGGAM